MRKITRELLNEKFNKFDFDNYQNHEFEHTVHSFHDPELLHVSITCKKCGMGVMRSFSCSDREEKMTEEKYKNRVQTIFRIMINDWNSKLDESCSEMVVRQIQDS